MKKDQEKNPQKKSRKKIQNQVNDLLKIAKLQPLAIHEIFYEKEKKLEGVGFLKSMIQRI